jgi:hypothetical protein
MLTISIGAALSYSTQMLCKSVLFSDWLPWLLFLYASLCESKLSELGKISCKWSIQCFCHHLAVPADFLVYYPCENYLIIKSLSCVDSYFSFLDHPLSARRITYSCLITVIWLEISLAIHLSLVLLFSTLFPFTSSKSSVLWQSVITYQHNDTTFPHKCSYAVFREK